VASVTIWFDSIVVNHGIEFFNELGMDICNFITLTMKCLVWNQ